MRPLFLWPIPIKLHPIPIRVPQIQRLTHPMIRRPIQFDPRRHQPTQRIRQLRARRIQNRQMIQAGCARSRRPTAFTLPGIQPNMMVIPTRRQKRRLCAVHLRHLKPQHIPIKPQRPLQISDLQVNMADARLRMDRLSRRLHCGSNLVSTEGSVKWCHLTGKVGIIALRGPLPNNLVQSPSSAFLSPALNPQPLPRVRSR